MKQYFAVIAIDKPGRAAQRDAVRNLHRAYLRDPAPHLVKVHIGGPLLDDKRMNGTLLLVEAAGVAEVERFVSGDPYVCAGLFDRVEIRAWDWTLGNSESRE